MQFRQRFLNDASLQPTTTIDPNTVDQKDDDGVVWSGVTQGNWRWQVYQDWLAIGNAIIAAGIDWPTS